MDRHPCRPGLRDWTATVIEAVFALWLLLLALAAPWGSGAAAGLITLAITGGISLAIYRRAVDPLLDRFLFGGRRRCLDPFRRAAPRLPFSGAHRDPEWAAIASVPWMPLDDYYRSDPWRQRRRLKLAEAGHRCQRCGAGSMLQVHHRTYRRAGRERRSDLVVLCCTCHGREHRRDLCAYSR
ncbi:MAG: HNH endonuclease [Chloroflexota bacterium]